MADNVSITEGSGTSVGADEISSVKYQRIKVIVGADGVNDGDVSTANPMPVVQTGTPTNPTGAATSAKQDTGNTSVASIDTKTPALGQALAAASVPVILPSATITTLTPPAAITGFATSSKQDTGNTSVASIDTKTPALGQALAAVSVPVVLTVSQLSTLTPAAQLTSAISTNNSSTATLTSGSTFTGTGEDVTNYSEMRVSVIANVASATDGISIQQSSDNTNWDIADTYTIPAATGKTFVVPRQAKFFRVVYTNGGTNQASFRLQSILNRQGTAPSSQRPNDAYTNETDLVQQQSFLMTYNGSTWDRLRSKGTGVLSADTTTINNVTPLMGNGVTGTGSQRVTVASDNTPFPIKIDQTTPGTTNLVAVSSISTSVVPGTAATNLGKAEDAAHTTGDTGIFALGVRNDTLLDVTNTTADYSQVSTDIKGRVMTAGAPRSLKGNFQVQLSNTTSETTILAATASTFHDVYGLILANTGAATTKVSIRDDTAGTVRAIIEVPALETRGFMLPVDSAVAQTAVNKNWTAQCATATTALEVTGFYVSMV